MLRHLAAEFKFDTRGIRRAWNKLFASIARKDKALRVLLNSNNYLERFWGLYIEMPDKAKELLDFAASEIYTDPIDQEKLDNIATLIGDYP